MDEIFVLSDHTRGEEQKADVQDVISPKAVSLFKRLYHLRSHRLLIFIFLVDIRKNNER